MKNTLFILLFFNLSLFLGQSHTVDSLRIEINNSKTDSSYKLNYELLVDYYRQVDSLDLAQNICFEMLEVAKKGNSRKFILTSVSAVSINYYLRKDHQKSISVLTDYIKLLDETDTLFLAKMHHQIGLMTYAKGDPSGALKHFFRGAKYHKMLGTELNSYRLISSMYSRIGDSEAALKYNQKVVDISKKKKDFSSLARGYLSLGYLYKVQGKNKKSFDASNKAVDIYVNKLKTPQYYKLGTVYGNIYSTYLYYYENCPDSIIYISKGFDLNKDYKSAILDSAKYYLDKSHSIKVIKGVKSSLIDDYSNYGDFYKIKGDEKEALKYYVKGYKMASEDRENIEKKASLAKYIYEINKSLNNFSPSLKYYEEYIQLNDSIFNQTKQRDLGKQEASFEFEKEKVKDEAKRAKIKAIEDARLEQEKAVAKEKESNQRFITYAIGLGLLLISLFTIVIFKRLKVAKAQQLLIESQKGEIEKNRNQMLESIEYSKNIQDRIFLSPKELKELLPNSFLYFRPKDVVSGDFYWAHKKGNKVYFSVADCTGHGVPGAFMTLISLNLINAIILEDDVNSTATILERLHVKLRERLTTSEEEKMKHGLDVAMCAYDYDTGILEYSGLHNPLYIIDAENELTEIKGDNLFLGISENFNVTSHKIKLEKGSTVYMSTDGFSDQKGGEKGKKYYYSRMRNSLRVVNTKPMTERRLILDEKFEDWKGEKEQIDDVCIMGVKF